MCSESLSQKHFWGHVLEWNRSQTSPESSWGWFRFAGVCVVVVTRVFNLFPDFLSLNFLIVTLWNSNLNSYSNLKFPYIMTGDWLIQTYRTFSFQDLSLYVTKIPLVPGIKLLYQPRVSDTIIMGHCKALMSNTWDTEHE